MFYAVVELDGVDNNHHRLIIETMILSIQIEYISKKEVISGNQKHITTNAILYVSRELSFAITV